MSGAFKSFQRDGAGREDFIDPQPEATSTSAAARRRQRKLENDTRTSSRSINDSDGRSSGKHPESLMGADSLLRGAPVVAQHASEQRAKKGPVRNMYSQPSEWSARIDRKTGDTIWVSLRTGAVRSHPPKGVDLVPAAALEDDEMDHLREGAEKHNTKSFRLQKRSKRGMVALEGKDIAKPRTLVHLMLPGDEDERTLAAARADAGQVDESPGGVRLPAPSLHSTSSRARIATELQSGRGARSSTSGAGSFATNMELRRAAAAVERALEEAAEERGDEVVGADLGPGSGPGSSSPRSGSPTGGGRLSPQVAAAADGMGGKSGRRDRARHPKHVKKVGPLEVDVAHRLHGRGPEAVGDVRVTWRDANDDALAFNEGAAPPLAAEGRRLVLEHASMRRRVFAREGWALKSSASGSSWAARWISMDRVSQVLDWREDNPHWAAARGTQKGGQVNGSVSIAGAEVVAARRADAPGAGMVYGETQKGLFMLSTPHRDEALTIDDTWEYEWNPSMAGPVPSRLLLDKLHRAPKQARWFVGFVCEPQEYLIETGGDGQYGDFDVVTGGKRGGRERRILWLALGSARLWREWFDWGVRATSGRSLGQNMPKGSAEGAEESGSVDEEAGGQLQRVRVQIAEDGGVAGVQPVTPSSAASGLGPPSPASRWAADSEPESERGSKLEGGRESSAASTLEPAPGPTDGAGETTATRAAGRASVPASNTPAGSSKPSVRPTARRQSAHTLDAAVRQLGEEAERMAQRRGLDLPVPDLPEPMMGWVREAGSPEAPTMLAAVVLRPQDASDLPLSPEEIERVGEHASPAIVLMTPTGVQAAGGAGAEAEVEEYALSSVLPLAGSEQARVKLLGTATRHVQAAAPLLHEAAQPFVAPTGESTAVDGDAAAVAASLVDSIQNFTLATDGSPKMLPSVPTQEEQEDAADRLVLQFKHFLRAPDAAAGPDHSTADLSFQADGSHALVDWAMCLWQAGSAMAGRRLPLPEVGVDVGSDDIMEGGISNGKLLARTQAQSKVWMLQAQAAELSSGTEPRPEWVPKLLCVATVPSPAADPLLADGSCCLPRDAGVPEWAAPCAVSRSSPADEHPSLLPLQASSQTAGTLARRAGYAIARADLWPAAQARLLLQEVGAPALPNQCAWAVRLWEVPVHDADDAQVPAVDAAEEGWWGLGDAVHSRRVWNGLASTIGLPQCRGRSTAGHSKAEQAQVSSAAAASCKEPSPSSPREHSQPSKEAALATATTDAPGAGEGAQLTTVSGAAGAQGQVAAAGSSRASPSALRQHALVLKADEDGRGVSWSPQEVSVLFDELQARELQEQQQRQAGGGDVQAIPAWVVPCIAQQASDAWSSASSGPSLTALVPAGKQPTDLAKRAGVCLQLAVARSSAQAAAVLTELSVSMPPGSEAFLCLLEREVVEGSVVGEAQEVWWAFKTTEARDRVCSALQAAGITTVDQGAGGAQAKAASELAASSQAGAGASRQGAAPRQQGSPGGGQANDSMDEMEDEDSGGEQEQEQDTDHAQGAQQGVKQDHDSGADPQSGAGGPQEPPAVPSEGQGSSEAGPRARFEMIDPMAGWLHKTDGSMRKWTRRFFVLLPTMQDAELVGADQDQVKQSIPCIMYFTGEDTKTAKGDILAVQLKQVGYSKGIPGVSSPTPYLVRVETQERTYLLAADDEEQAADWAHSITELMHATKAALKDSFM